MNRIQYVMEDFSNSKSSSTRQMPRLRLSSIRFRPILQLAEFLALLSSSVLLSQGEVITTNIVLNSVSAAQDVFSVPSGKVFILEHVGFGDNWIVPRQIKLAIVVGGGGGAEVNQVTLSFPTNFNTLSRPLKLGDTMRIRCEYRASSQWIVLFGLLVDPEDLYASIPSEIEGFAKLGTGSASGKVKLASPRPSLVKIQQSTNLPNWIQATGAVVASSGVPEVKNFTVLPAPGDRQRFFRATARALQSD